MSESLLDGPLQFYMCQRATPRLSNELHHRAASGRNVRRLPPSLRLERRNHLSSGHTTSPRFTFFIVTICILSLAHSTYCRVFFMCFGKCFMGVLLFDQGIISCYCMRSPLLTACPSSPHPSSPPKASFQSTNRSSCRYPKHPGSSR